MNKNLLRSTVFTLSTLLFALWTFCMSINWDYIQNLRQSDPLWLVKGVSPWLFIIILIYLLLFFIILYYNLDGKLFHIIFISYLVLVTDTTPYFLAESCRFIDTFEVVRSSILLPQVLSHSIVISYARSFPVSYMLFYITHLLAGINLFSFSRYVFSPLILVSLFVLWYLFVTYFFNSKVAFISTIVAIPSQIIEISITPNSLGIILVLVSIILCTSNKWNFRLLFFIIVVALVLSHAINPFVLLIFLLFFYLYNKLLKTNILDITGTKIWFLFLVWVTWITSDSCMMGTAIIKNISKIMTMGNKNSQHAYVYTSGSGNLAATFSWIQNFTMYKYELYAIIVMIFIIFDLYYIGFNIFNINKKNASIEPNFIKKYAFLTLSLILLVSTVSILLFGGSDTENLISRTLNFSMLFVSLFIGYSFNSFNISSKFLSPAIKASFIVFLLLTSITYPLYSYGKDSYINFPVSQEMGSNFYRDHVPILSLDKVPYSKRDYFFHIMHGRYPAKANMERATLYNNEWYYIFVKGSNENEKHV